MGSKSNVAIAIGTVASAVLAAAALGVSFRAYSIADSADQRAQHREERQHAEAVYLGEAPRAAYTNQGVRRLAEGQAIWRMAYNASGIQIENVWVRSVDGRTVRIQGMQACTMYALPSSFVPADLFFTDPRGEWRRHANSGVLDDRFEPMPADDTDDSPWYDTIGNCSG